MFVFEPLVDSGPREAASYCDAAIVAGHRRHRADVSLKHRHWLLLTQRWVFLPSYDTVFLHFHMGFYDSPARSTNRTQPSFQTLMHYNCYNAPTWRTLWMCLPIYDRPSQWPLRNWTLHDVIIFIHLQFVSALGIYWGFFWLVCLFVPAVVYV